MFSLKRFFLLALIVFLLSSIQRWAGFSLPFSQLDLVVVFVLVALFFLSNPTEYLALAGFSVLLLQESSGFDRISAILLVLFVLAFFAKRSLLDRSLLSVAALILCFTLLSIFLLSPDQFFSFSLALRVIYNELVGLLFFVLLRKFENNL
ncbi:MAG: hypothetical protein Q8P45_02670 [Candidatus Harrisonbacteria bacterium]|nr:hypothetical protein [Candidatus Harrisonbacteria bacterium]